MTMSEVLFLSIYGEKAGQHDPRADSAKQVARAEEFIELAISLFGSIDELESDRDDDLS